jgi:hypothetical protein
MEGGHFEDGFLLFTLFQAVEVLATEFDLTLSSTLNQNLQP